MSAPGNAYPVPEPPPTGDPRFTIGVTIDVVEVLARHGYPKPATGADWVRVQSGLFSVLYGSTS